MIRYVLRLMLVGALAGAATMAAAQTNQPITGLSLFNKGSAEGSITALDPATRSVTVATSDGRNVTGKVSEAVGGFANMKVGDKVFAGYEQRLDFVLSGPDAKTPANSVDSLGAVSGSGNLPGGAGGVRAMATWVVVAADTKANTLSLVDPGGGQVRAFDVRSPEGRATLSRVKPGDKLTITYSEFVFGVVTPRS